MKPVDQVADLADAEGRRPVIRRNLEKHVFVFVCIHSAILVPIDGEVNKKAKSRAFVYVRL